MLLRFHIIWTYIGRDTTYIVQKNLKRTCVYEQCGPNLRPDWNTRVGCNYDCNCLWIKTQQILNRYHCGIIHNTKCETSKVYSPKSQDKPKTNSKIKLKQKRQKLGIHELLYKTGRVSISCPARNFRRGFPKIKSGLISIRGEDNIFCVTGNRSITSSDILIPYGSTNSWWRPQNLRREHFNLDWMYPCCSNLCDNCNAIFRKS